MLRWEEDHEDVGYTPLGWLIGLAATLFGLARVCGVL
jgi:hypothetical protein